MFREHSILTLSFLCFSFPIWYILLIFKTSFRSTFLIQVHSVLHLLWSYIECGLAWREPVRELCPAGTSWAGWILRHFLCEHDRTQTCTSSGDIRMWRGINRFYPAHTLRGEQCVLLPSIQIKSLRLSVYR